MRRRSYLNQFFFLCQTRPQSGSRARLYYSGENEKTRVSYRSEITVGSDNLHAQHSLRCNFVGWPVSAGISRRKRDKLPIPTKEELLAHIATVSRVACSSCRTDFGTPSFLFLTAGRNSYRGDDNVQSHRACDHCNRTNLRTFPVNVRFRGTGEEDRKRALVKTRSQKSAGW